MAGKRKCVCCGEFIGAGEESVPYKGRYAHIKCFQIAVKALKNLLNIVDTELVNIK